jgi:hypothetical protein
VDALGQQLCGLVLFDDFVFLDLGGIRASDFDLTVELVDTLQSLVRFVFLSQRGFNADVDEEVQRDSYEYLLSECLAELAGRDVVVFGALAVHENTSQHPVEAVDSLLGRAVELATAVVSQVHVSQEEIGKLLLGYVLGTSKV